MSASIPTRRRLRDMSQIRHALRTNTRPICLVGATPLHLLGLDRWVRGFSYVVARDPWDGAHPLVMAPSIGPPDDVRGGAQLNNWLLGHPQVRAHLAARAAPGVRPMLVMVDVDARTEQLCAELGYDLALPRAALRERLDSTLTATRLGIEAGAPSVPHVLCPVRDYAGLLAAAQAAGLGTDLVVRTASGDSGTTTFFVADESGWKAHEHEIAGPGGADQVVTVMRRTDARTLAVEAVLTRHGTLVGPVLAELTGDPRLTPYRGGWCGDELSPGAVPAALRARTVALVRRLGDRLAALGYLGAFGVDVLVDDAAGEVYLGELHPRISGASAITTVAVPAYADLPLFAFHLLEHLDVDYDLDVEELDARWCDLGDADEWGQLVISQTSPLVQLITRSAPTGHYEVDRCGRLRFGRVTQDWHDLQSDREAFYLPLHGAADTCRRGTELGVLVTKGRLQERTADGRLTLTPRALALVDAIRGRYAGVPLAMTSAATRPPADPHRVGQWRTGGDLRWTFTHTAQIFPTATIPRGRRSVALHRADVASLGVPPLERLLVRTPDGARRSVAQVMEATDTDGWMVARGRDVLLESYREGFGARTPHLLLSVSKSIVGAVAGILVGAGRLDPAAPVGAYVPQLRRGGYADASVRDVLDMRSGARFSEGYLDAASGVHLIEEALGWRPRQHLVGALGLRAFLSRLEADRPAGGSFRYRSCESDVLGWVCEAASGERFPRLAGRLLWARMGAEFDATIGVDHEGTGLFDGGIAARLGDIARFGLLLAGDGVAVDGERVLPAAWVRDTFTGGPDTRAAFAASPDSAVLPGGGYRNQCWLPYPGDDVLVCLGIHGQLLYVDRRTGVVGAKLSSWPAPQDQWKLLATLAAFRAIDDALCADARATSTNPPPRVRGPV